MKKQLPHMSTPGPASPPHCSGGCRTGRSSAPARYHQPWLEEDENAILQIHVSKTSLNFIYHMQDTDLENKTDMKLTKATLENICWRGIPIQRN